VGIGAYDAGLATGLAQSGAEGSGVGPGYGYRGWGFGGLFGFFGFLLFLFLLAEAGTLRLHPESVDLGELLADVGTAFGGAAEAAGLTLAVDAAAGLAAVEVDPVRISEVLANLVANAIRHTPSGGAVSLPLAGEPGWQVIRVADTRPGIDPALLPNVFDRFVKSPESHGSGLGLAIARNLVEGHGGTIEAASAPGLGTTMTVRLPERPPE
jgi:two-component system sensor histidine kinase BaeS